MSKLLFWTFYPSNLSKTKQKFQKKIEKVLPSLKILKVKLKGEFIKLKTS